MMLLKKRRIALDEKARVPFAVLAVMIFLLSSFSVAYLGATTRQEIVNRLLESDLRAQEQIGIQVQNEVRSGLYVVCVETIHEVLREINSGSRVNEPFDTGFINATFQELLEDFLSRQFPRRIKGHLVEETGHLINLLPKVERVLDLVPKGLDPVETPLSSDSHNHSKIDTVQSEAYGPTNATSTYMAIGYLNISIRNLDSPLELNRTLWVEREIVVPLPFLFRKMDDFQSNSVGSFSDISRITKYILTTIAQFKALQGYGMKSSNLPSELVKELRVEGNGATELLTVKDVELAINLALLLESVKTFRTWDTQVTENLHSLLLEYSAHGTIDAADLAILYIGDNGGLNIEIMLAQAIYGVLDQFILKFLDYSGLMPLADEIWKGVQTVDGVLQRAGDAIQDIWDWFSGRSIENWSHILEDWLERRIVEDGGLETEYFLRLLVGDRRESKYRHFKGEVINSFPGVNIQEEGYTIEFVVRQMDDYHTWFSNGSEQPHRRRHDVGDAIVGYDHSVYTVVAGFDSPEHRIAFEEVDIGEGVGQSGTWQRFFESYFTREEEEKSTAESIREHIREVALEIAKDAVRRASALVSDYRFVTNISPSDGKSFLTELQQAVASAMDEIVGFYRSPAGREELKKILSSFSNGDLGLIEDLKHYLADEYDNFVDRSSILQVMTESVACDVLENHSSFDVIKSDTVENTNVDFDWVFEGNLTGNVIPMDELKHVFRQGGAKSLEQFTVLQSALLDDVDSAYQQVKKRETAVGGPQASEGVLIQVLDAAEEQAGQDMLALFVGGAVDFLDGVGFLDMALDAIENFLGGMLEGSQASNAQYILPLRMGEPFEFWEGDRSVTSETNTTKTVTFHVDQLVDNLPAQWNNIDPLTEAPEGNLYVDFNPKGFDEGDHGYDSGDIRGKHYTDILIFSDRPFETKWNLSVLGRVPIHVRTNERTLLGPGGHRPIWLNRFIEINFSTTIVVYTGWELEGVEYDLTSDLLTDIVDFLDVVWETIKEPLMDIVDYFQKLSDFFRNVLRTLLEYGSQAVNAIADATDLAITLLQTFLSNVLTVASDFMISFLKDFSLEHFLIEFAGFTFEVKLAKGKEKEKCQCGLWVRARGDLIGFDLDFTTYLVEFDEPVEGVEQYITVEGGVGFGQGGLANVTIDPFMLIHPYMVEIHATDLNTRGDGWALDLLTPELDIYKNSGTSLSEIIGFVPTIPIPMLAVEVGVDFGVNVKHTAPDPGSPTFDFRLVMSRMMRESFSEAWQEIDMSFTLDFLETFIRRAIQKFIDKLTSKLEETILEVMLFLDLGVSAMGSGGSVGGGFRLGFVVDRAVLSGLLHWLVDAVETFVDNLHNPFDQSPFASLPNGLSEHLGVRFEVYFGIGYPRMLSKLSSSDQSPKRMDLAISVQPNVPAIMMLAGVDWGEWKVDFGAYLENFPLNSLGNIYTLSKGSTVDLYLLKGQIYEVCTTCG
jgi:hypothetical protein